MFQTVLLILAAAMAVRNVRRLLRQRDSREVVMLLFWSILAWRIVAPQPWQAVVLTLLLLLRLSLSPVIQKAAHYAFRLLTLRKLTPDERLQRASLDPDVRSSIKSDEWFCAKRFTRDELQRKATRARRLARIAELREAKEQQEELDEAWERQRQEAERRSLEVTSVHTPFTVRFHLAKSREFTTSGGAPLVIPAGDHTGELILRHPESKEYDDPYIAPLGAGFTYVREGGDRWHGTGTMNSSIPLDLKYIATADPPAEIRFWEDADLTFRANFQQRCILAGLEVADDCRDLFPLKVSDKVAIIKTKYRHWKVDLAVDEDERSIWVRVSELQEDLWKGDPLGETDTAAQWKDSKRLPAFYYSLPIEEFLPVTCPGRFAPSLDEARHVYHDGDGSGVIFTPVAS